MICLKTLSEMKKNHVQALKPAGSKSNAGAFNRFFHYWDSLMSKISWICSKIRSSLFTPLQTCMRAVNRQPWFPRGGLVEAVLLVIINFRVYQPVDAVYHLRRACITS